MSIGSGQIRPADDPDTTPPYSSPQVALSEWPPRVKGAWQTFQSVKQGDMVLWGERAKPLTVASVTERGDGTHDVEVEGPRGGRYTLRERYTDGGHPRFYADDSKAMDLRLVEGEEDDLRAFTEEMYENVVENLKRAAINNYVQEEHDSFEDPLGQVVNSWIQDVQYQRWSGWPYEWHDDDPDYIFRMIREHADRLPEPEDEPTTPANQARVILREEVRQRGREMAHAKLIESTEDYFAQVDRLADLAVERDSVKAHMDARQAAHSVVDDFIDAHSDALYRSILQHAETEPDDIELYEGLDERDVTREMAFDILDQDVWARARELHEERGTHDPTIRGIAFFEYDELVEAMVEDTLREHNINDNRILYTTANEVVRDFEDAVERHEMPYSVGGADDRTWGAGDVEDIFSSITMHAEVDPHLFNPFTRDKERKMAAQVLTEVVHERASNALDERELQATKPVPADEYLDEHFGGMTLNDIRDDSGISPEEFIRRAIADLSEDELEKLAGWTFVDELVEEAGATVPFMSGPWVLADYGLVRTDLRSRRLAWFNRDTGDVLYLSGEVSNPPEEGEYGFEEFDIYLVTWDGPDQPEYLQQDVPLEYAYEFIRDYTGADSTDVQIIETATGSHWVSEAITEDDIRTRPLVGGIAPSFDTPGPGFNITETLSYGTEIFRQFGRWLSDHSRVVDALSKSAVALAFGESVILLNRVAPAINIRPDYDKKHGVGIRATYEFGAEDDDLEQYDPDDPDSSAYTGKIDGTVKITPGAVKFLADMATPAALFSVDPDGKTTTFVAHLGESVERPLRERADRGIHSPRRAFLGAHFPASPDGRPEHIDDYETPKHVTIAGHTRSNEVYLNNPDTPLDEDVVRDYLHRLAAHGYMVETSGRGYYWDGDARFREELGISKEQGDALGPAEVQELGYSLSRNHLVGPSSLRLVGSLDEVVDGRDEEAIPDDATDRPAQEHPVCTNRAFLQVYTDLPGTPNKGILNTVWEFYKARAEDSDDFTVYDAYDRFRMGLVYDAGERVMERALRSNIRQAAAGHVDVGGTDIGSFQGMFQQPEQREYWWLADGELAASEVFDREEIRKIGPWLIFPDDNRPSANIEHYWVDTDTGEYYQYVPDGDGGNDRPYAGGARGNDDVHATVYRLTDQQSVFNALVRSAKNAIATDAQDSPEFRLVKDPEEFDPDNPVSEEDRKWLDKNETDRLRGIASGNVDWDALDGTDLSIWGLFLRGTDRHAAMQVADHFNLSDRFQTRLSDVIPANFEPTRPDIPSFEEWLDTRRGRNAIGSAGSKARAKATYLRELTDFTGNNIETRDALGVDSRVESEIELQREAREHLDGTDFTNYEQFYGEEFGEAFDDVAQKFAEGEPADQAEWNDTPQPTSRE